MDCNPDISTWCLLRSSVHVGSRCSAISLDVPTLLCLLICCQPASLPANAAAPAQPSELDSFSRPRFVLPQVIHSGGGAPLHRRVSANGRMQAAPACPPDVEALQQQSPRPPPAKRQQQRSLPQPAGSAGAAAAPAAAAPAAAAPADRGGKGSSAAAAGTFPNIPTTVPRVRSAPADDDFDVKSEVRSECGRGGRGRGKARGLSERDKEQRDLKRKVRVLSNGRTASVPRLWCTTAAGPRLAP